jgi:murein DD-endopeptidase MepM/ murein hydrolase activator NlpD
MTAGGRSCSGVSILGNHRRPDKHVEPRRPHAALVRTAAATGAFALSIWALNLSGTAADVTTAAAGPAGMAAISAGSGAAVQVSGRHGDLPSGVVGAGSLQTTIVTDPSALVSFPRAALGSYTGDSSLPLSVGHAGLDRPPAGFLRAPLELLISSSPFGHRVSPLSGAAGDFHLGQDYAAPCGTRVYAADSGVVRAAGWHPWGGGNRVEIDHGNGLVTTYNHLDAIAVHTGDKINVGQFVAEVGTTGWSTGCHLHFETILDGRHISPLTWGLMPARPLAGDGAEHLQSYAPGSGSPLGWLQWIIPVGFGPDDHMGVGGAGTPAAPASPPLAARVPAPGALSPSPSPSEPSATPTPSPSEPSATPTPSPSEPTPTPTPSEPSATPTASPSEPTPTPSESVVSPTPTPTPTTGQTTPSATETTGTPTPTATPTPTTSTATPTPTVTATPTEPTASPSPSEPSPTPSGTTLATSPSPSSSEASPSPTPSEQTPSPTPTPPSDQGQAPAAKEPEQCLVQPAQETSSPDQYPGPLATNSTYEQLPEDAACDTLVPDPADPERWNRD